MASRARGAAAGPPATLRGRPADRDRALTSVRQVTALTGAAAVVGSLALTGVLAPGASSAATNVSGTQLSGTAGTAGQAQPPQVAPQGRHPHASARSGGS